MSTADDIALWNHAKLNGFMVVSLDSDFYDLSVLHSHPPKLIWLRCGNSTVEKIERLLRSNAKRIEAFAADATAGCLEIL
jgi:predicted nuclease of predicted toxin-antitoxin system